MRLSSSVGANINIKQRGWKSDELGVFYELSSSGSHI